MDEVICVPDTDVAQAIAEHAPVQRRARRAERGAAGQRLPARAINKAKRATFVAVLSATSSVAQAARATGVSVQNFYALRDRDTGFAADWAAALAQGRAALEAGLLAKARGTADSDDTLDPSLAMAILKRHDTAAATGNPGGRRSKSGAVPLRAICDELLRRVALTVKQMDRASR